MININFNPAAALQRSVDKLHIGRASSVLMDNNHPNIMPSSDANTLVDLNYGSMPHPMSSAEIGNRNIRS